VIYLRYSPLPTTDMSGASHSNMGAQFSNLFHKKDAKVDEKPTTDKMASFTHFSNAATDFKPKLIANENAFLEDIASSEKFDTEKPISAGFYRLEKGTPLGK
jgi:hypothetical protein